MTDIVEWLRKPMAWAMIRGGTVTADDAPFKAADEIERLQAEVQGLRFQPNHRKLTRDIIRSLILEIRTLRLEAKQRDQQSGRS